jgi:hypothetical protein
MTVITSRLVAALVCAAAALAPAGALAQEAPKPVAGKQVHFPHGTWSALPQLGPNGKVLQCVLLAPRRRAGGIDTRFSLIISRGSGLVFGLGDDRLPREEYLDDRAEIVIDRKTFPAIGFTVVAERFALHPGNTAGVLRALAGASKVTLRSAGAGIDSGPIEIVLPGDALAWLKACGEKFDIAIDRPTDPNAPPMPVALPPSPEIGPSEWTAVGPPGMAEKQKINTWDASELRDKQGKVIVCMIRRHYFSGSGRDAVHIATFFSVSRAKGLTAILKSSTLKLTPNTPIEAKLTINDKPFTGFSARAVSGDEIMIYPEHASALAAALDKGASMNFKSKLVGMELPVQRSVMAWLRACARRHAIAFEGPGR